MAKKFSFIIDQMMRRGQQTLAAKRDAAAKNEAVRIAAEAANRRQMDAVWELFLSQVPLLFPEELRPFVEARTLGQYSEPPVAGRSYQVVVITIGLPGLPEVTTRAVPAQARGWRHRGTVVPSLQGGYFIPEAITVPQGSKNFDPKSWGRVIYVGTWDWGYRTDSLEEALALAAEEAERKVALENSV